MTLLSLTTQAQCSSIAVEVDTNESCAPGIFEFVAKNAPSGSFFAWDFGKGSIPGNDTFKLIEPNARSISLTLYIALATGKQCTTVVKKIAEVYKRPTPSASINKKIFCSTSEEFEFTDLTSNSVFRIWTIEGINYGDTANIKKGNFSSDGKKNISLMVEDSHGCRGFKSYRDITEVVSAKDVKIKGVNNRGCVNSDLSFSVESGFSPTQIKSISWSFSGGLPVKSTEVSPRNIRYAKGGNYDVSVELTTKNGCTYSDLKKGIAQPKDSLILNVAISDSSICTTKGVDVRVLNKSTSSQLFFNVPNFDTSLIDSLSTSQRKFTFTESGVFDLFLTHVDSFCTSHYLKKAFVSAKKVQARMNASNHYGCKLPFLAKFSDTSFFSEPGNVVYRWMVYDSLGNLLKTSNKKSFEYLVKDSGYYDVDLTVRHENGCADSFYRSELIRADSIRIDYTPISEVVCLNQEVIIQNSSLPSSYNVSDVFEWRLYRSSDATTAIDSSFISRPTFKAKFKGSYDLKVVAYNALGCRQTDSRKFVFEVGEPKAGLRVENPNQCPSDTFSLISSNDPRNGSYINRWIIYNEKDTLRSTGENPIVEIDSPGIYNVTYHISIFGLCRDTVTKKDLISINGIQSVINISTNRTCSKIPVSPKANVRNYINPSTDTVFKYQWDVFPNSGYSIDNDTIKEPTIYFQQDGKYIIRLISQNEFGCLDTAYSDTIVSGLNMKQVFLDTAVCANAPIRFTNSSDTFINKWYYTLSPDESFTIKNNNKDTSIIWITKEGVYTFHIVASRDSLCFDTASTTLHIVSPKAEFFPIDSNLYCAPVYQRFESKSTFADTLFWDFGDGKQLKTTLSKVTTLYEQNTGSINPYSVRLIAKNKSGCADTLVKQNLVKVDGPSAKLTLSQIRGCEPLAVTFNGPVENVHKMYIDYGDGGEFGFSLDEPHYYKNNWRIIEQQYRPVILVIDKNGCQTAFKTDSTIVVKPSPTAIIGIVDSIACSKLRTRYYYLGNEATSWFWDFEGDGKPDGSSATGVHKYQTPGRYNMTLINMNTFGCSDTAMSPIHVVKSPQISILTDSIHCVTKPFRVSDLSVLDTSYKSRMWTIQTTSQIENKTDSSFIYLPEISGNMKILLNVIDSMDCTGQDSIFIRIRDSSNNVKAAIDMVSVLENGYPSVSVAKPNANYLSTYVDSVNLVNVSGGLAQINGQTLGFTDSLANTNNRSHCYQISHSDSCDFASALSEIHCTVHLSISSISTGVNDLAWTPYIGWKNVSLNGLYQIWREINGQMELLTEVNGQTFTYSDSFLCDEDYCYKIVAVNQTKGLNSNSNTVCSHPVYLGNSVESHIKVVSVVDDNFINVVTESDSGQFTLLKSIEGSSPIEIKTNDATFSDYNVDVQNKTYSYGVIQTDHCGSKSAQGRIGKSILLSVDKEDVSLTLTWTAYKGWNTGVKSYDIMRNSNQGFVVFKQVSGFDTSFVFNVGAGIGASNCFRIVGNSFDSLSSHSNNIYIEGEPIIFIPNAFSPFDHAVNNSFKPYSVFIKSPEDFEDGIYDFKIYDKWGGLIFETNNPALGWDGRYNGIDLPESVYIYTFRVKGLDDRIRTFSGSVTLVR